MQAPSGLPSLDADTRLGATADGTRAANVLQCHGRKKKS